MKFLLNDITFLLKNEKPTISFTQKGSYFKFYEPENLEYYF